MRKTMTRVSVGRLIALLGVGLLPACVDMSAYDGPRYERSRQASLDGAESGARFSLYLTGQDIRQINRSAWTAVNIRMGPNIVEWSSYSSGAVGKVTVGPNYLVGFNSGEEIEAPLDLDTRPHLAPATGVYLTNANSNVRLSPNLSGSKVVTLEKGVALNAVAREEATDWYLVASKGKVIGYVFGELLDRTEGGDLLLAGGEPAQPRLCRELTYTMTLGTGEKDAWVNGACKEAGGKWRVIGGRALEVAVY